MTPLRRQLLERYGTKPVPRYTSYPPANHWKATTDPAWPAQVFESIRRPLSIYVHVPFCKKLCWYCGCNMLIDHRGELVERYLAAIEREFELVSSALPAQREVVQVHLGGGTPTHLTPSQLERLIGGLRAKFPWAPDIEASIEVHPPVTSYAHLETLASLGFNRLSMGVQDFDEQVQQRVNRPQPFEQTRQLVAFARALGFESVNMDLMYGLPLQTVERFATTLELVKRIDPDRLALFGYAHMPSIKKHQQLIDVNELPKAEGRLALLELGINTLEASGYTLIGLDHFSRSHDELVKARENGTLRRNFMGYTTCRDSEVIAFGPSAISEVEGTFLQNQHDVRAWCTELEAGRRGFSRVGAERRRLRSPHAHHAAVLSARRRHPGLRRDARHRLRALFRRRAAAHGRARAGRPGAAPPWPPHAHLRRPAAAAQRGERVRQLFEGPEEDPRAGGVISVGPRGGGRRTRR